MLGYHSHPTSPLPLSCGRYGQFGLRPRRIPGEIGPWQ